MLGCEPKLTATVAGLKRDADQSKVKYTLKRASGEALGTYTITATGNASQGNYAVEFGAGTFTITKKDLASATVRLSQTSFTCTGEPITPTVTVTANRKTLSKGVDYKVAYSNNIGVGTGTVIVSGIGNFSGSASQTFTISADPKAGTAAEIDGASYEITASSTVIYKKAPKSKKKVAIPETVTISGKAYRVAGIAAKAFKGAKAKKAVVKTKSLTKASVKKCFKGAKKLKVVKAPKGYKKAYKQIFAKKNSGKKVKVK